MRSSYGLTVVVMTPFSALLCGLNDPENYFVSFVPVEVDVPAVLLADAAAFVVIMLLLLIPTLFISRVDPAQTVRVK